MCHKAQGQLKLKCQQYYSTRYSDVVVADHRSCTVCRRLDEGEVTVMLQQESRG